MTRLKSRKLLAVVCAFALVAAAAFPNLAGAVHTGGAAFAIEAPAAPPSATVAVSNAVGVGEIASLIELGLALSDTVVVTGTKDNADDDLVLHIPTGKTVIWRADYSGADYTSSRYGSNLYIVDLYNDDEEDYYGGGTFIIEGSIAAGAAGFACAVYNNNSVDIVVSGGTVTAAAPGGACGICSDSNGAVTVTGGTVTASSSGYKAYAIDVSNGAATVTGGTVTATAPGEGGYACAVDGNGAVTVTGGTVTATAPGEGGSAYGVYLYGGIMSLTGGTVTATEDDYACAVYVDGGVALLLAGAYVGSCEAYNGGLIVEIDTVAPDVSRNFTYVTNWYEVEDDAEGLTIVAGDGIAGWLVGGRGAAVFCYYGENEFYKFRLNEHPLDIEVDITEESSVDNIKSMLGEFLDVLDEGDSLIVTGEYTGADKSLNIYIDCGKTIYWKADYSGEFYGYLIELEGEGRFVVAGGTLAITAAGGGDPVCAICSEVCAVTVSGGTVSATATDGAAIAIYFGEGEVTVTGGTVTAKGKSIAAGIGTYDGCIAVTGGKAEAAVEEGGDCAAVWIFAYGVAVYLKGADISGGFETYDPWGDYPADCGVILEADKAVLTKGERDGTDEGLTFIAGDEGAVFEWYTDDGDYERPIILIDFGGGMNYEMYFGRFFAPCPDCGNDPCTCDPGNGGGNNNGGNNNNNNNNNNNGGDNNNNGGGEQKTGKEKGCKKDAAVVVAAFTLLGAALFVTARRKKA